MKKQILIIAIFTLAIIFAGTMNSFAQIGLNTAGTCQTPTPLDASCASNPLTPMAGVVTTYTVAVPTPAGAKTLKWWVTTDPDFIVASALSEDPEIVGSSNIIIAAGTNYNTATVDLLTMTITWDYFVHDPANPVFLVVYAENVSGVCTNDNIEVFIIEPMHSFTLDVRGVALDGTVIADGGDGPCAAPVVSASWVIAGGAPGELQMNYGVNYLFFIVTAANFNHSWAPSFQVSGDGITGTAGDRIVTAIDWQTTALSTTAAGWNATVVTNVAGLYTGTGTTVPVTASAGTVGSAGECIVVRVTVDNGRIETAVAADIITFAVDGIMYDAAASGAKYVTANLGDIHYEGDGGSNACPWVDGYTNDIFTQVITARPDVNAVDPTPFVPKN